MAKHTEVILKWTQAMNDNRYFLKVFLVLEESGWYFYYGFEESQLRLAFIHLISRILSSLKYKKVLLTSTILILCNHINLSYTSSVNGRSRVVFLDHSCHTPHHIGN